MTGMKRLPLAIQHGEATRQSEDRKRPYAALLQDNSRLVRRSAGPMPPKITPKPSHEQDMAQRVRRALAPRRLDLQEAGKAGG